MTAPGDRRAASDWGAGEPEPVPLLTVPLLFGGLLLGFFSGYMLMWWGLVIVACAVVMSLAMFWRNQRIVAISAAGGTALGYLLLLALALFRGVI